jgi:hypothetical protein
MPDSNLTPVSFEPVQKPLTPPPSGEEKKDEQSGEF